MLPPHSVRAAYFAEAAPGMNPDRCRLGASDHADHLAETASFRSSAKFLQQSSAEPLPAPIRVDVEAVFGRPGVGGPVADLGCIGVSCDLSVVLDHDERPSRRLDVAHLGQEII
jgi:hypothetical protein